MVQGRVVQMTNMKSSNVYVQWAIGDDGKREIESYMEAKDNDRMMDEDESSKLDQIIKNHIRYLHYNCAK